MHSLGEGVERKNRNETTFFWIEKISKRDTNKKGDKLSN